MASWHQTFNCLVQNDGPVHLLTHLHGIVEFCSKDNDGNCLVQDDGPVHLLNHLHGIVEFWREDNDGNCLVQDDGTVHILTQLHGTVEFWSEDNDGMAQLVGVGLLNGGPEFESQLGTPVETLYLSLQ